MFQSSLSLKITFAASTSLRKMSVCSRLTFSKTTVFPIKSVSETLWSVVRFPDPFASWLNWYGFKFPQSSTPFSPNCFWSDHCPGYREFFHKLIGWAWFDAWWCLKYIIRLRWRVWVSFRGSDEKPWIWNPGSIMSRGRDYWDSWDRYRGEWLFIFYERGKWWSGWG